jgi:hypothetical protein
MNTDALTDSVHSTVDMTANVYTHSDTEGERKAAIAIERAIYGDRFQTVPETTNKNEQAAIN